MTTCCSGHDGDRTSCQVSRGGRGGGWGGAQGGVGVDYAKSGVQQDPPQKGEVRSRPASDTEQLEQRVTELEIAKAAQEDATRSIIRDALSKLGPNINEFVA